jgi:hypothetical protein
LSYREGLGHVGRSIDASQSGLRLGSTRPLQRFVDGTLQETPSVLRQELRLIEAALAKSRGMQWHSNKRVDSRESAYRAGNQWTQVLGSGPFGLILELQDGFPQPAVEWTE